MNKNYNEIRYISKMDKKRRIEGKEPGTTNYLAENSKKIVLVSLEEERFQGCRRGLEIKFCQDAGIAAYKGGMIKPLSVSWNRIYL